MDFTFSTNDSRSGSNSPTAARKFGFQLSSHQYSPQWHSQEHIASSEKDRQCNTLPNPKTRSASVADVLNEDASMV